MEENQTTEEVIKPTYEELETKVAQTTTRITYLESTLADFRERVGKHYNKVESVKDYLIENHEEIGEEHTTEIAELLGIELATTKTFDFTITVSVDVEAGSPFYDWSDFDGSEIDFDITARVGYQYRSDLTDASVEDYNVDDCNEQ
jgi:hypothetical protein